MLNGLQALSQPATALANLALITPATNYGYHAFNALSGNSLGPAFLFNFEKENRVRLQSEFPDSWLEDNSALQDHAINKPPIIDVHAVVGEVVMIQPPFLPIQAQIQSVLTLLSTFTPGFSKSATNIINEASQAYQEAASAVNGAVRAWANLTGNSVNVVTAQGESVSASQNQQQQMFSQIYGFWSQQTNQGAPALWTIQTPYAVFSPCGLVSADIVQEEDSDMISEFSLSFKLIRILNETKGDKILRGRAANLGANSVNNGTIVPTQVGDVSTLFP